MLWLLQAQRRGAMDEILKYKKVLIFHKIIEDANSYYYKFCSGILYILHLLVILKLDKRKWRRQRIKENEKSKSSQIVRENILIVLNWTNGYKRERVCHVFIVA